MRRVVLTMLAAFSIAGCQSESTGPAADLSIDAAAFGTALTTVGGYEADLYATRLGNAFPDALRLSDEQRAKIKTLVDAFESATQADREALGAILRRAREAASAGKTRAEVTAILKEGETLRSRLAAAQAKLKADIDTILTAEQKAWIASHTPRRCDARNFPPLSDAQKAQIRTIERAFAESNHADIFALRDILAEARTAASSGKSAQEVAAILEKGAPIAARLAIARASVREQIAAVLTPEQKATGCFPLG